MKPQKQLTILWQSILIVAVTLLVVLTMLTTIEPDAYVYFIAAVIASVILTIVSVQQV